MCQRSVVFYIHHIIWPVMPRLCEMATKGCNLCLDCGFCQVHLGYSIFHLGSCPIYLIFFFASLKIAEREKKLLLVVHWSQHKCELLPCTGSEDMLSPFKALEQNLPLPSAMQMFYSQSDSPCVCFTLMLCAKLSFASMQNECRIYNWDLQCRWVISQCWPKRKIKPHTSCQGCPSDTVLHVWACSPHPDGIFASKIALQFLRFAFPLVLIVAMPFVALRGLQVCFLFETSMQCDIVDLI